MINSNRRSGMWQRASDIALKTPSERNRYVDFLRALAITVVILGHWIMAAPSFNGAAQINHLLDIQPWSQWLTWLFQVMPVFFFVGGFANGVSWDNAKRREQPYASWLDARLRRLLGPAIPLVFLWTVLGIIGFQLNISQTMISLGSQISLVPVWFLAIYFAIVLLVPITRLAWQHFGFYSVITPLLLAVGCDWLFFNSTLKWINWLNYLLIWGAMHQLGYAWEQQKLGGAAQCLTLAGVSFICLLILTVVGPYPVSLVGVPSQELSNTTPPKLPLVALGLTQIGLLLSLEKPLRNWLENGKIWTATVLTNGLIMPIFLWHSTIMMLTIGLGFWLVPDVFNTPPGSSHWWLTRPIWVFIYFTIMLLGLPLFIKLEKWLSNQSGSSEPSIWVISVGGLMIGIGLALLAKGGIIGGGLWGLNWWAVGLPIAGMSLITLFSHFNPAR